MKTYDDSSLDATNPAARVPVVVLLDTSSSRSGEPIAELNAGINRFFAEVCNDDAAAMSAVSLPFPFDTREGPRESAGAETSNGFSHRES